MARLPYAAIVLIEQVRERHRRSATSKAGINTGVPHGDPDGFGVQRSVKFDKTSSKWLGPAMLWLDDPRIVNVDTEDGHTVVTFSHRIVADQRDRFPLDAAEIVANNASSSDSEQG